MTVTNSRVILHLPKTAGSTVRWRAMENDGFQYACQHCSFKMLPNEYKGMKIVSFIREPLDWYVSYYEFTKKRFINKGDISLLFVKEFSEDFEKSFQETLPLLLDLTKTFKENPLMLEKFKLTLKSLTCNKYVAFASSYFDNISTITPESFEHKSMYQWYYDIIGLDNATVYRIEDQFEEGMLEFNATPRGRRTEFRKKNQNTDRDETDTYYTKELKEMVLKADKYIINKHYSSYYGS